MDRLSAHLGGPRLLVKRDDETGLATGGNKARKLEFLVGQALADNADVLVTGGAPQSNHARQTAAAAARFGLGAVLVLRGQKPATCTGNLLLNMLLGAEIRWAGERDLDQSIDQAADELRHAGRRPAVVPYGGSNMLGAAGYVAAMEELVEQQAHSKLAIDVIVFASSSGGTQAGLMVGAKQCGFAGRVLGISVDKPAGALATRVATLANETAGFLELPWAFAPADIDVNDHYLGGGYAVIGEAEREAINLFARIEGLLLDPVYTGRAAAGLIDLVRRGDLAGETVLFWHTGGTAGLFGFGEQVLTRW
jgi:D-cysteine desulfhydrase